MPDREGWNGSSNEPDESLHRPALPRRPARRSGCGGSEARKERSLERGREYLAARDFAKARVEFRNALQVDPKDAAARTLLAEAAERLGNYEEAAGNYRAAIDLDPAQVQARARLARMMVFGGVPDQALELLGPGLEREPKSADLLAMRGAARMQQGDTAAARQDPMRRSPSSRTLRRHRAARTLLWREGKREEALALLGRTLEASADDVMLREIYAELLLESARPADAACSSSASCARARDLSRRFRLAQLYASQRQTDRAVETLRDAVKASPRTWRRSSRWRGCWLPSDRSTRARRRCWAMSRRRRRPRAARRARSLLRGEQRPQQAETAYREVVAEAATARPA